MALRVTRLRLVNWRNFTRLDVRLERRAFLVGPNASGKSNLLDAVRFLHDIVDIGGGFQEAIGRRHGVSRIRSLSARKDPTVAIEVEIGNDETRSIWTYRLELAQDNQRRPFVKREVVSRGGEQLLNRPDDADLTDPARLAQTHLEQVNVNKPFREIVDFMQAVRYLHLVPQLVREPDRSIGRRNDPFGGDFLETVAAVNLRTQTARLRRIRDALRVAVPQLQELDLWRDAKGAPHLRGRYEHWRARGAWQTEEDFSDGTLRLVGLLWALLQGDGTLLLEEPELSLHPDVISYVPQMFGRIQARTGRQILVSTHSPDLLRDEDIDPREVLLLQPGPEGTTVRPASSFDDLLVLLASGVPLGEAVVPLTRPTGVQQLALFGD
jgi:predicted ATPase